MTSAADRESGPADTTRTLRRPQRPRPAQAKPRAHRGRAAAEWITVLVVAVLLAAGLRTLVFQPFSIPSTSMVPTLDVGGDRILVQKAFFNWHDVRAGDIVVFKTPGGRHQLQRPGKHRPGQSG